MGSFMHVKPGPEEESISLEQIEADVASPSTDLVERTLFRGGVLSAFGSRDFTLLWSGAFLSNTGTWIHTAALLWYVKILTDSDAWVGAVNLASYLPVLLFVMLAGSLADHLNRKMLILGSQVFMMLGALALGVLTTLGAANLGVVMALTALMGVAFVFNFPAWRAIVPDLVPARDLLNGVALDAAQFNMARFVGPALGAFIISAWSVEVAFYINAASFLAVLIAVLFIKTKTPSSPAPPEGVVKHVREGLAYVWANRWAQNLLASLAVVAFFGISFIVLLPGASKDVLQKGAGGFGWLMGAIGLGAVVGAPLVTIASRRVPERDIVRYSVLLVGLLLMAFSFVRVFWLALLLCFGIGVTALALSATINSILQARAARDIRGRVMSLYILVFQGLFPVGGLLMGYLSDARSISFALILGGGVCTGLALLLFAVPSILAGATSAE